MASKVIKGGTVVTADLSYEADVKIEGGKIVEIGPNLSGDETLDATGCYVMPGGIDPHTHLEMPFMGTFSSDNFDSGTRAALSGGTTMVVDFALPSPGQGLLEAIQMWDNKSTMAHCDYSFHMAITWWGEQVFNEMETVVREKGINTFKHFMAYKGALMVNDDEMFASFQRCAELGALPLVHAENGDVVATLQQKAAGRRQQRSRSPRLFPPAGSGRRSHKPCHYDRGHGRRPGLHRAYVIRAGP
jgi:dihydropyrimidinase